MDFKDTLLMPNTDFPMRGNLGVREVEFQNRWKEIDLYNQRLKKNEHNDEFMLHDGPPYANGSIHIGHAFQKTLKDFVLRYQSMKGMYTRYIPGWDTHGLPIENAVTRSGVNRKEIEVSAFRKICREFALSQVAVQKEQFKRLGILGEWDDPYLTLDKTFISDQIRIFAKLVKDKLIYRGLKPIYWSPSSESALAEAEIEHMDKNSYSIYVSFKVVSEGYEDLNLLVWTTTPWTLPANLAVSVNESYKYVVYEVNGIKYLITEKLLDKVVDLLNWQDGKIVNTFNGKELENLKYKHPLYDRVSPIILGDHVTDLDGTGLVHTAPGHGEDDYIVGRKYNLDILCPVDDRGIMTSEAGPYEGMFYEKANDAIIKDLEDHNALILKTTITHSYPHDWRTHQPVIFRATPQWFFSVDKIKNELLENVENVSWLPKWGELRISNMLKDRDDWVISRQRAWGVPIPIFYDKDKKPILNSDLVLHIANLFETEGSDIWYERSSVELIPKSFEKELGDLSLLTKETDIMDVWFDSGTSYSILTRRGLKSPADLYLEGSDQYRGWFNSSLTTSVAAYGKSPYKLIVSHGFVLDGRGRKMSKSLGNVIDPVKMTNQNGADILRLWTSSVDYQQDVRISDDIIKQASENYRKIRNTFKFMLGNLNGFNYEKDYIAFSMRGNLNRAVTNNFKNVYNEAIKLYESYNFEKILKVIIPFIVNDLSSFYLDYTKDILYILNEDNFERLSVVSTYYDILLGLLKILTPIIPHTTSEAYSFMPYQKYDDVYLESIRPMNILDAHLYLQDRYNTLNELRDLVLKELEVARDNKVIGKSLQASLSLTVDDVTYQALDDLDILKNLNQVLIVSEVNLVKGLENKCVVSLKEGHTCERCWNIVNNVNEEGLCPRCESELGKR